MATLVPLEYTVPAGTTVVRGGIGTPTSPPTIVTHPQPQTVIAGATATFDVVAIGTAPLAYQWRKNGVDIVGATAASYTTPVLVIGDNGAVFSVLVSNAHGNAPSNGAALTVQSNAPAVGEGVLVAFVPQQFSRWLQFVRGKTNSDAYDRFQQHTTLDMAVGATHTLQAHSYTSNRQAFLAGSYSARMVSCTTREVVQTVPTTAAVTAGVTNLVSFTFDITSVPQGWYYLDITGGTAAEVSWPYPVFVKKELTPQITTQPALMPSWTGSYEVVTQGRPFRLCMVPAQYAPTEIPLSVRTFTMSGTPQTKSSIFGRILVFGTGAYNRRPNLTAKGVRTTANWQSYFIDDQQFEIPRRVHVLDGPRGRAVLGMVTHIAIATAAPNGGPPRNTVYACTAGGLHKIYPDGRMVTLCGYRWKGIARYWEDVTVTTNAQAVPASPSNPDGTLELVGDWSAVPANRRGFWSIWGLAWKTPTTVIDTNAPFQETEEGPEQPHPGDVVAFVADTQRDRIVKLAFNGQDRSVPVTVTEFINFPLTPGGQGADPWDVVYNEATNTIYVSLRRMRQINEYNADTGAFVRTVVQGADLGGIAANRIPYLYAGPAFDGNKVITAAGIAARQAVMVVPEGLFLQDGWLYWSSLATYEVKRINLGTNAVEVKGQWLPETGDHYSKFAVSDGTFMPRGTVFLNTWNQTFSGWPHVFNPDGTRNQSLLWDPYDRVLQGRIGGKLGGIGNYGSAFGVGLGRLVGGSSREGLYELSIANLDDPTPGPNNALLATGDTTWVEEGWELRNGATPGLYGTPPPWGRHPGIDERLRMQGVPVPPTSIIVQPQPQTVQVGEVAVFRCEGYGASLSYQAQRLEPGGSVWANVGAAAATGIYSTPAAGPSDNGAQYRFLVNGSNGSATSSPAILTVNF